MSTAWFAQEDSGTPAAPPWAGLDTPNNLPAACSPPTLSRPPACLPAAGFGESNLKHGINGYLYCNLPGLTAPRGTTLRLLLVGMGSEGDMHSPAFTSQVLQGQSTAYETAELMPTVTKVADVRMEQAGQWPVYCEVHDHFDAGMRATLVVTEQ